MPLGNSRGSLQDAPFVQKLAENVSTTNYKLRKTIHVFSGLLEQELVRLRTSPNRYVDFGVFGLVA
jgi:hypothetical protein